MLHQRICCWSCVELHRAESWDLAFNFKKRRGWGERNGYRETCLHVQHVMRVWVPGRVEVVQELDFVQGLVKKVLVVFDHFQAHRQGFASSAAAATVAA